MGPTTVESPLPGPIGRYRILGQIGAGGMGTVYSAHDPDLNRVVALKLPRFEGSPEQQAKRKARFQREARVAAQVWHPHVCPIFDVGEHEGQPFVVMALVEGQSLAERLASQGRFEDVGEAVQLMLQLLDALAVVHACGITHRDVKPGNILLDAAGRVVLTDFGLASDHDDGQPLTSEGMILGTPSYMAPEQALGQSNRVGPATDLYSVGVVLFQILTGRLPFEGPPLTVLHRIVHESPPAIRQFRSDLAPSLEAAVLRVMQKDPAHRFSGAKAFAAALTAASSVIASGPTTATVPLTPAVASPPRRPGKVRWTVSRLAGWLIGAVLVTIGGLFVSGRIPDLVRLVFDSKLHGGRPDEIIGAILGLTITGVGIGFLGVMCWLITESFFTPEGLFHWTRAGSRWCVEHLIANRVPVDARNAVGDTPLMVAASLGHADVVKILLVAGARSNLRNPFGQSALDIARDRGRADIVGVMQPFAAQPEAGPEVEAVLVKRPNTTLVLIVASLAGGVANITVGPRAIATLDFNGRLSDYLMILSAVAYPVLVMGLLFLPLLWWTTAKSRSPRFRKSTSLLSGFV